MNAETELGARSGLSRIRKAILIFLLFLLIGNMAPFYLFVAPRLRRVAVSSSTSSGSSGFSSFSQEFGVRASTLNKILLVAFYPSLIVNRCICHESFALDYEISAQIVDSGVYSDRTLQEETTNITARIGTTFGFTYGLNGSQDGAGISLRHEVWHPEMRQSGENHQESTCSRKINTTNAHLFTFQNESELVPGNWLFFVADDERIVAQKTFVVRIEN